MCAQPTQRPLSFSASLPLSSILTSDLQQQDSGSVPRMFMHYCSSRQSSFQELHKKQESFYFILFFLVLHLTAHTRRVSIPNTFSWESPAFHSGSRLGSPWETRVWNLSLKARLRGDNAHPGDAWRLLRRQGGSNNRVRTVNKIAIC